MNQIHIKLFNTIRRKFSLFKNCIHYKYSKYFEHFETIEIHKQLITIKFAKLIKVENH